MTKIKLKGNIYSKLCLIASLANMQITNIHCPVNHAKSSSVKQENQKYKHFPSAQIQKKKKFQQDTTNISSDCTTKNSCFKFDMII